MRRAPLVGVLVVGNMGGKEDREPGARIDREAVPRLKWQPAFVKVARGILDHKARGADRVHRLTCTATCQKVHAGQIALAAVLVGGDEGAGRDHQGAVFAMVGVEVARPGAEDGSRAGEEMGFEGLACFALVQNAAHTALGCAVGGAGDQAFGGGNRFIRQLSVYRPVHRCLKEGDPRGPEVYARAANLHPQHRQLQLQL